MATLSHGESRCMYSWWWDSHISPKNSKWLQENISEMDKNVKTMIKLVEEDGDSFAKRAEMFYKSRPELMQLIEVCYRAYRALAERYDHANSALRQAHQTMSEAFPDRLPPLLQLDELEETDQLLRGDETANEFEFDFEDELSECRESGGAENEFEYLQSEVSRLSQKNENFMKVLDLESKHAQALEEEISILESKKDGALIQYKLSMKRISGMETYISNIRHELCMFNHELMEKLKGVEEQCNLMEKINKIIRLRIEIQETELENKKRLLDEMNWAIEEEYNKRKAAEASLKSLEKLHVHSQEEERQLLLAVQNGKEKLREMEVRKKYLEDKIMEHKYILDDLHEQNRIYKIRVGELQDDVNLLQEAKRKIEFELGAYVEENSILKSELCCLNEQIEAVSRNNVVLENSLSDANNDLKELKEKVNEMEVTCEILLSEVTTNVIEKGVFVNQMETISQYMERLSEKNENLEKCLYDANSEIKGLRSIFRFLSEQKSLLLADKSSLITEVENLKVENLELQNRYSNLEKANKSSLHQITDLESLVKLEIQEHENLILSFSSQVASLNDQIHHLQNEICANMEDIKVEQHKFINSSFEILILQQSLHDMKEKFLILSREYQHLLETSRRVENNSCVMEDKVFELLAKVDELERMNSSYQDDCTNLKTEKDLLAKRLIEHESSSRVRKQGYEELQLTSFVAQFENFILKKCISDMKDQNQVHSTESEDLLEMKSHNEIETLVLSTLLKQIVFEKHNLHDELQKKTHDVHKCEAEIRTLLNEIQVSTVNAATFEEKVVELISACESLESLSMSRREILNKDIALKNAYIEDLKKNLDDLKAENSTLKSDLNAYSSLLMSLSDGVWSIEEQILSLARMNVGKNDNTSDLLDNKKVDNQSVENRTMVTKDGFSNLRRLIAKIEDLQIMIIDTKNALEQERQASDDANTKSARKKIGQKKLDKILLKGITKEKLKEIAKDIQLDQTPNSHSNNYVESEDQMLELWETSDRDDIQLLSVDKLEISPSITNRQTPRKWYRSIIEKLNANGLRLSAMQKNVHDLKAKIEYGTFKVQLREVEYDIYDQIEITLGLKNKVESSFLSESERMKISDEECKCAEVTRKLEMEVQKIEYVFLKIKEEEESKNCRCADKKSSIISMRYLQFKKDGKVKKKGRFCGCMKPNTKV